MEKSNNSAVLNKGKMHRRGVSRSSNDLKTHELPNCQNKPFHYNEEYKGYRTVY